MIRVGVLTQYILGNMIRGRSKIKDKGGVVDIHVIQEAIHVWEAIEKLKEWEKGGGPGGQVL